MSTIAQAIANKLTTDSSITATVNGRVYPNYDLQKDHTYPLIVYKLENVSTVMTNEGPVGLQSLDLVLASVSTLYSDVDNVTQVLVAELDGTSGIWSGVTIQGCFLHEDGIQDESVTEPETETLLYYVKTATFQIWYSAS